jgi:hypothetical protein
MHWVSRATGASDRRLPRDNIGRQCLSRNMLGISRRSGLFGEMRLCMYRHEGNAKVFSGHDFHLPLERCRCILRFTTILIRAMILRFIVGERIHAESLRWALIARIEHTRGNCIFVQENK